MAKLFTNDIHETLCSCGGLIHLNRRGNLTLIPSGHKRPDGGECPALEYQRAVLRTQKACMSINSPFTERELIGMLQTPRTLPGK